MLYIIISFALFCVSYFLSLYAWDKPKLPKENAVPIKKPTVHDLPEEHQTAFYTEIYVDKVIIPYDRFLSYSGELSTADRDEVIGMILTKLIPFLLILKSILGFCRKNSFLKSNEFLVIAGSLVASILVCFLLMKVVDFIYKNYFLVPEFFYPDEEIEWKLSGVKDEYHVGTEMAKSNCLMLMYLSYYYEIVGTMRKRIALRSFLISIYATIYFLFFIQFPS